MAVISKSAGYLFIMAPRTGCTAIADLLCDRLQGSWFPEEHVTDSRGRVVVARKHCTQPELIRHSLLSADEAKGLLTFTAVRNPYDSLVSLWYKQRTRHQQMLDNPNAFIHRKRGRVKEMQFAIDHSFDQWVTRRYRLRQWAPARHLQASFLEGCDEIMRFEHLQEDFDAVLARLGLPPTEIPLINPTEGRERDYQRYYTPNSQRIVTRMFGRDLERFGYSF